MFFCFEPSALRVTVRPEESIEIASSLGYAAASLDEKAVCARSAGERAELCEAMRDKKLLPGPWNVPFEWRKDEIQFQTGLAEFKTVVKAMADFGPGTAATWIAPFSSDLDWNENLRTHAKRLRLVAEVLQGAGMSLALEFLGTRSLRQGFRFEFVHSLRGITALYEKLGAPNAGMVLDLWSVHASGQGAVDLDAIEGVPILHVQIGDAPGDRTSAALDEGDRYLPGTHNVVDNAGVLAELSCRRYEGPVSVEAYAGELERMTPRERAKAALAALWSALRTPAAVKD